MLRRPVLSIFCAVGLVFSIWTACHLFVRGGAWQGRNDFLGFYAGAQLAGTPDLYDYPAIQREQARGAGVALDLQFARLPVYALLLKPIAWLPYGSAYLVWLTLMVAAFLGFAFLWQAEPPGAHWAVCCWSIPAFVGLFNGQDVLLALFWFALAVWLHRANHDFTAGFALALCASKFHLFLLIPLVLAAQRRWRMIGGALSGTGALLAISTLVGGFDWPYRYWAVMTDPRMNPSLSHMPNLHSMFGDGRSGLGLEASAAVLLAAGVFLLSKRSTGLAWPLAVSLAASLLTSHHSFLADGTMLLPALTLAVAGQSWTLRILAMALAMPFTWIGLQYKPPLALITQVLIVVFVGWSLASRELSAPAEAWKGR